MLVVFFLGLIIGFESWGSFYVGKRLGCKERRLVLFECIKLWVKGIYFFYLMVRLL